MANNKNGGWRLSLSERRTLLIIGDLIVSLVALASALLSWATISNEWLGLSLAFFQERVASWFYFLPIAWILLLAETYDIHKTLNWRKTRQGVSFSCKYWFGALSSHLFCCPKPFTQNLCRNIPDSFLCVDFTMAICLYPNTYYQEIPS